MLSKQEFSHISGPFASRIGDKIVSISMRVSVADFITWQSFLQAESCATLLRVMFEVDTFLGTPLKQQYLIPEIV